MTLLVFRERPGVAQILGRTTAVPASKSTPCAPPCRHLPLCREGNGAGQQSLRVKRPVIQPIFLHRFKDYRQPSLSASCLEIPTIREAMKGKGVRERSVT